MSWHNFSEFEYVSVAERKKRALKKIKALEKSGQKLQPVEAATARGLIAKSFWGKAWCRHLEAFSDYEYRLPRGRSYIRHGAVIHLLVKPKTVIALVNGSELYELTVTIDPLAPEKWAALKARCQGKIGSLIELLQGKLSDEIMTLVTDTEDGLFPQPKEIHFNCNCPDWADMCKHVAAALYGVGARLDASPELLFKLRGVDQAELIALDPATSDLTQGKSSRRRRTLDTDAVSNVFGIELEEEADAPPTPAPEPRSARKAATKKTSAKKKSAKKALAKKSAQKKSPKKTLAQETVARKTAARKAAANKATAKKRSKPSIFKPTAAKLRQLRQQQGLSRAAFARELGVSATTISNWEKKTGPLIMKAAPLEALQRLDASGSR